MGLIGRFEKGLDRAVNGVFAKAFRSEVQPVEIASALRRECDDKASIVASDRTVAPNSFVVELGTRRLRAAGRLGGQLCSRSSARAVIDHARQQRYAFVGPVSVAFEQAEDLDTGVFRVRSATARRRARRTRACASGPHARRRHPPAAAGPGRPRAAPADRRAGRGCRRRPGRGVRSTSTGGSTGSPPRSP